MWQVLQASTTDVLCSGFPSVAAPSGPAHHRVRALSCRISCGDITAFPPSPSEAESPSLSPGHGNWRCPLDVANNGMKGWILQKRRTERGTGRHFWFCTAAPVMHFNYILITEWSFHRPTTAIEMRITSSPGSIQICRTSTAMMYPLYFIRKFISSTQNTLCTLDYVNCYKVTEPFTGFFITAHRSCNYCSLKSKQ